VPGLPAETTNRVVSAAATELVVGTTLYFAQSVVIWDTVALAYTLDPSLVSISSVTGPVKPGAALAQNEALYVVAGWTGMPKYPSLAAPTRWPLLTITRRLVVRAVPLTGCVVSSAMEPDPPPS